jgi:hypothetical protein
MLRRVQGRRVIPKSYFQRGPTMDILEYEMTKLIKSWFIEMDKHEVQDLVELPTIVWNPDSWNSHEDYEVVVMEGMIEVPDEETE